MSAKQITTPPATTPGRLPPMTPDEFHAMRRKWREKSCAPLHTFKGHKDALAFCGRAIRLTGLVSIPPFGAGVPFTAYTGSEKEPGAMGGTVTYKIGAVRALLDKAVEAGALTETRKSKLKSRTEADAYNAGETLRARRELDAARCFVGPCDLRFLEAWK